MEASLLVCERLHPRHDPRWLLQLQPPLCLACVIEVLGDGGASLVRRKHVLSCFRDILAWHVVPVIQLLAQDERVCVHFIGTLFGMLHTVEDNSALDLSIEVLVMLVMELKSEQYIHYVLDESQKELYKPATMRGSLPTFILLGKLADAIPVFADMLVIAHGNLVDHLLTGLMYPNEGVKASVCYLYGKLYSSSIGAEKLSVHFTEKLCGLFLATLGNAQTKELQANCMGLLKELLKSGHFVSVIMSSSGREADSESANLLEGENPLPLVLKKLLLSRDETLQVASTQCMAAVLVHSPVKYAPAFIHADIPEFLFDCLSCTSEILIWSVYCCLLLLTEEWLFFSKCHTVYGIESLVRSLREILLLNNVELHKQGLLLFTEILKRQPGEIKLFTNHAMCKNAISVLMEAVNCPVLEVAAEAVKAVAALLRKDHLSSPPMPYEELQTLMEAMLKRCADLSLPRSSRRPAGDLFSVAQSHSGNRNQTRALLRQGQFLLSTLDGFRNACRLAVECQSDPSAQENAFTAPSSESENTLSSFSAFLLRICDHLCIPLVMKHSGQTVSPTLMEVFISTLNTLFTVVPSMCEKFSRKLVSSSFIRLTLELKAKFCSGQSNPDLNQACSCFLYNVCLSLHSTAEKMKKSSQEGKFSFLPAILKVASFLEQEMSELLQRSLPQLNYSVPEGLILLSETAEPFCLDEALHSHKYCFLLLLYFAYTMEDRFVPEAELFSAIRSFLLSVQDQGDYPPPYVFRAVLYLLAICQDKAEALDLSPLCAIKRIVENISDVGSIYVHHPLLLKFFLRYSELVGRFGHQILQLWFSWEDCSQMEIEDAASELSSGLPDCPNGCNSLLHILKGNSSILLILLDLVCSSSVEVAHKVLMTLKVFLKRNEDVLVCDLLRSQFLQILQQLLVESSSATLQANRNLPLLLSLIFLVQLRNEAERELDTTDFKLLHHVSNLCGKCRLDDAELLQPSLNFLYWSLHQTMVCSQQRVVAVLLSSVPLLELLQRVLDVTWTWPSPSEPALSSSEEALLCSAWLLTASLLAHQHSYNSEVHQPISLNLEKILNVVIFRRKKPALLLVGILQLLRFIIRQNFSSSLLVLIVQPTAQSSLESLPSEDNASLYPLTVRQVLSLVISLQNLLAQKDLLLSQTVVACLEALMEYLHVKNQDTALHVASQPWNQFLLFTLLSGGEKSFLCPEILRLLTLFVRYQNNTVISQSEISQILQEATKANLLELPENTSQALRLFLLQVQSRCDQIEPAQAETIQTLLETLPPRTRTSLKNPDMMYPFAGCTSLAGDFGVVAWTPTAVSLIIGQRE
ncbi:PREDICTED: meiosis inhibitor protein 1 [Gavialis gangeticus]|uniref:meiosis inhibitor protein 1 n=1 Tax=Gavialis gangeticus TaxID=94835 RepID=UPI00092F39ED|nr:PREDICTED: meiosis inhibitor protein 1 [Gavialis gangeticus]